MTMCGLRAPTHHERLQAEPGVPEPIHAFNRHSLARRAGWNFAHAANKENSMSANPKWHVEHIEDIETVPACPVCGETVRDPLHANLTDGLFHCSADRWNLWRCGHCHSAYLDPRPTPASIHQAYASYYTHQSAPPKRTYTQLNPLRRLRRALVNGYTNAQFGTQETPALAAGAAIVRLVPKARRKLDREYRHLPRSAAGTRVVLDIGCGSGEFLKSARACGWSVVGVDPDPRACDTARLSGLDVRQGGLEQFDGQSQIFDAITMSHVIEHVHQPAQVLKDCLRLLRPGGHLWLETPNIGSLGHARYGRHWRGLEPPRHLVLFNQGSLISLLKDTGFQSITVKPGSSPLLVLTLKSELLKRGLPQDTALTLSFQERVRVWIGQLIQAFSVRAQEFINITAIKP